MDAKELISKVAEGDDPKEVLGETVSSAAVRTEIREIRSMLTKASSKISSLLTMKEAGEVKKELKQAEKYVDDARQLLFKVQ